VWNNSGSSSTSRNWLKLKPPGIVCTGVAMRNSPSSISSSRVPETALVIILHPMIVSFG
jgi:hypothetical protein